MIDSQQASKESAPEQQNDYARARKDFVKDFKRVVKRPLGPWKDHPDSLWTEIRAYLLGMALPFPWKREGIEQEIKSGNLLSREDHLALREKYIGEDGCEKAHVIATRIFEDGDVGRFFLQELYTR